MRVMLKSKIHRATVTDANLNYEGSITIDRNLMKAADILPTSRCTLSTSTTAVVSSPMPSKAKAAKFASTAPRPPRQQG